MIKTITNIEEYQYRPILETNESSYNTPIILFGKEYLIQDDYWMKHIHLKITDKCNAHCPFCIEKDSDVKENPEKFLRNLKVLLKQMSEQGHLTTISVTGGEPFLCNHLTDALNIIREYSCFLTINTNATCIKSLGVSPDWINISRHKIGDDKDCGLSHITKGDLEDLREKFPHSKIRIQSVINEYGMKSVDEILEFVNHYKDLVDDFSIRQLISVLEDKSVYTIDSLKWYLYQNAMLIEQVLKDYYVYETWNYNGANITLSHSNMVLLHNIEKVEKDNVLREIIVHPDGLISGSWYRNKKIIF